MVQQQPACHGLVRLPQILQVDGLCVIIVCFLPLAVPVSMPRRCLGQVQHVGLRPVLCVCTLDGGLHQHLVCCVIMDLVVLADCRKVNGT